MVEGPSVNHHGFGQLHPAQGGPLECSHADGVHAFGQDDFLELALAEEEGGQRARTALDVLRPVFHHVGFAAAGEGGAAEVEAAQATGGGHLVVVAAGHLAEEEEVGAVERALDGELVEGKFFLFANERGERARRFHADAAPLGRQTAPHAQKECEQEENAVFHERMGEKCLVCLGFALVSATRPAQRPLTLITRNSARCDTVL